MPAFRIHGWLERVYVAIDSESAKSQTNYPGHFRLSILTPSICGSIRAQSRRN